ncbi:carbonic anhydrase 12 [Bombina bombina]|uniref:carbonic anhydrase 12 n=1 Tax=Bombina bombina TaxID=8345 RepID=UPI00235A9073|nr:carbonic anhydrase 12 [Bombina bombina]
MYGLLLTLLNLPAVWAASHGSSWAYVGNDGENSWAAKYGFCGGVYQSPLDFHQSILQFDSTLLPIKLSGYNASSTDSFTLSNNGHTVKMSLLPTMHMEIQPFHYAAAQLHFHWGSQTTPHGSEHCIGGKRFPAEVHVVHYNTKYDGVSTAMSVADGLAVLGILIEVGPFNPAFDRIISQFHNIHYKDQMTQIPGFNVRELLPERLDEYYRYEGSLTTPPCNPSVLWTVFRNPVFISEEQLLAMETALYCTEVNSSAPLEMINNYRKTQAEGERLVSVSFREGVVLSVVLACVLGTVILIGLVFWLLHFKRRSKAPKENKNVVYTPTMTEENSSKV